MQVRITPSNGRAKKHTGITHLLYIADFHGFRKFVVEPCNLNDRNGGGRDGSEVREGCIAGRVNTEGSEVLEDSDPAIDR